MDMSRFFLGTHIGSWLWKSDFPLCLTYQTIMKLATRKEATCYWFLDSGAYSELNRYGRWTVSQQQYIEAIVEFRDDFGKIVAIAPQDWMCEPWMIEKTGLSVLRHQNLTIKSFLGISQSLPNFPVIPILQGFTIKEYVKCVDLYYKAGVDLANYFVVGIGSVCRRQSTNEIHNIIKEISSYGIRLHGFGVKQLGFNKYGEYLYSSDSLAWSYNARRHPERLATVNCWEHVHCGNCINYARIWRSNLIRRMEGEYVKGNSGYIISSLYLSYHPG